MNVQMRDAPVVAKANSNRLMTADGDIHPGDRKSTRLNSSHT